jgi:hypothetical protein
LFDRGYVGCSPDQKNLLSWYLSISFRSKKCDAPMTDL